MFCVLFMKQKTNCDSPSFWKRLHLLPSFFWLFVWRNFWRFAIYDKTRHRCIVFSTIGFKRFMIVTPFFKEALYVICTLVCTSLFLLFSLFLFPCVYIIAQILHLCKWYSVQTSQELFVYKIELHKLFILPIYKLTFPVL